MHRAMYVSNLNLVFGLCKYYQAVRLIAVKLLEHTVTVVASHAQLVQIKRRLLIIWALATFAWGHLPVGTFQHAPFWGGVQS